MTTSDFFILVLLMWCLFPRGKPRAEQPIYSRRLDSLRAIHADPVMYEAPGLRVIVDRSGL